ncbi:MAG TPA: outer membrane beta-barrel protein [Methylomirabilota bacterium]|jgi:opacity protein-like surface antigen|nr:outer membrane beta-barrel protein [Methylomirabilota bacterium]
MFNKFVRLVFVPLVILTLASVAQAQMGGSADMGSNRPVSFGIGGGVSVPVSDASDAFDTGFNGQGFVRFNLPQFPIQPRVDFTFSKFDVKDVTLATPGASGTGQIFAGIANVQYSFMHSGFLRPYIVAGLGAYNTKTDISGIPGVTGNSSTDFGINAGLGAVFKISSAVSGYVEGRIDNVYSSKGMIQADQVQVVPVTFGLVF